jgi:tetratricopeptide (TPR) repeat protein
MTETPLDIAQAVSVGIAATDRGDYQGALKIFLAVYTTVPADKMPDGLSAYGLCLARVEGKRKMGAELCQRAIQLQSYEARHRANLVRVYIVAKNRKKAVETLDDSMKKLKNDPELIRVRQEIGYRQAPMLTFLPRQNPINKWFGLYASKLARRSKIIVIVIATLAYIGIVGAIFKVIVK